jgi:hypothetical protein
MEKDDTLVGQWENGVLIDEDVGEDFDLRLKVINEDSLKKKRI